MTYLLPSLSWPEFCLEWNWNQSGVRIFLLVINIKALPSLSSLSQNSQLNTMDSLSYVGNYPCVISSSTSINRALCYFSPPWVNRLFIWLFSFRFVPLWSILYMPTRVVRTFMIVMTAVYWYFICITHLIQIETHTHIPQTSITPIFHMRKPRLSEVKNLTHFKELLRYRAKI